MTALADPGAAPGRRGGSGRRRRMVAPGRRPAVQMDAAAFAELRAALAAGAAPSEALAAAAGDGPLAPIARDVRLGRSLFDAAATVATGDPTADLLVRALAVAEASGAGSGLAVEQAVLAARDEAALRELLRVRTVQARGTAVVLTVLPAAVWLLLVAMDAELLAFYGTIWGLATGVPAVLLAGLGLAWSRRLVRGAERGAERADPLAPSPGPCNLVRGAVLAVPALILGAIQLGPVAAVLFAAAAGVIGARPTRPRPAAVVGGGGTAEAVELLAVAMAAGLPPVAAVDLVAPLSPPLARPALATAARRLRGGWTADAAFADGGMAVVGRLLAASERWGAPAHDALRRLAEDLRAARRSASDAAGERVQLALVFPTTLLTLPAFVLGVVPPLLWSAFAR